MLRDLRKKKQTQTLTQPRRVDALHQLLHPLETALVLLQSLRQDKESSVLKHFIYTILQACFGFISLCETMSVYLSTLLLSQQTHLATIPVQYVQEELKRVKVEITGVS